MRHPAIEHDRRVDAFSKGMRQRCKIAAALVITAPLALLEPGAMVWHVDLLVALAWSVLVLSLGGSSLLMMLIQRGAATRVTSLLYLVPPCTALMGWLLFSDVPTMHAIIGGVVISAATIWVARREANNGTRS